MRVWVKSEGSSVEFLVEEETGMVVCKLSGADSLGIGNAHYYDLRDPKDFHQSEYYLTKEQARVAAEKKFL